MELEDEAGESLCDQYFTTSILHTQHTYDSGGVFPHTELGSFSGTGSSWHECLMTETVKGLVLPPFPLVDTITHTSHLTSSLFASKSQDKRFM